MPMRPLDISGPDGAIDATLHTPADGGRWPGVLMLSDIRGTRPAFRDMADRLAGEDGYAVLLPNVYYREGRAPVPDLAAPLADPATMTALFALKDTLPPARMRADGAALVAAMRALPEVKDAPVGVVGYCMGGAFAIYTAQAAGGVAAVASYHGGGLIADNADSPHRIAATLPAALYFGHADHDATIPEDRIPELEAALAEAGADFASEVYPGAQHGFAVPGSPRHDAAAAARHWTTMLALFARTLR